MGKLKTSIILLLVAAAVASCQPAFLAGRQHRAIEAEQRQAEARLAEASARLAEHLDQMDARVRSDFVAISDSLRAIGQTIDAMQSELAEHRAMADDRMDETITMVLDLEDSLEAFRIKRQAIIDGVSARIKIIEQAIAEIESAPSLEDRPEASPLPSAASYEIAVATLTDEEAAARLAQDYEEQLPGLQVRVSPATMDGRQAWRVGVGTYATFNEAAAALDALREEMPHDAWIAKRIDE